MNKIKLFGKWIELVVEQKQFESRKTYEYDGKKIIFYSKDLARLEELKKMVFKDLFYKEIIPLINEQKNLIEEANYNSIKFVWNQKQAIKFKWINKHKDIKNVDTYINCRKCNSVMKLQISKTSGKKYLKCSNIRLCNNIEWIEQSRKEVSKNGFYIEVGPNLLEHSIIVIKSKIAFTLILSFCKYKSIEMYLNILKYCPNYYRLNKPDTAHIKEYINDINNSQTNLINKETIIERLGLIIYEE